MTMGFSRVSERLVHEGHIIDVVVGTFRAPDGSTFDRDVVHHPGAVSVVPLLDDGRVVLVRQYRAPIDDLLLEIPAGIRDVDGEPPEQTARRELVEETGYAAAELELLISFQNSAGFSDERVDVFLATGLTEAALDLQGIEEQHMTIETIALDDVPELIARGELTDAKSVIGLLLTMRKLGR
jgi:8-oxo-dGTP pyrophosphatase MutT (NUDIX family)